MIATWAARSSDAADQGAPIAISYENNIWGPNVWAILKGTPKLELCREFVKFACEAQRQAALAPHVVNGPINPDAFQYIDPDRARQLTTYPGYRETSLRIDDAYWAANRDQLTERFNAWLLS